MYIQVWDGVSNRCINTFKGIHTNESVSSVRFSKNSKYILSSGRDSKAMLWELSTGREGPVSVGMVISNDLLLVC